ncbi:MAG: class I SAM-dependent rRNA methyltransferase [bacterium]
MDNISSVWLKKDRDKPALLRHHPWIFSGAVKKIDKNPLPGDIVRVVDSEGSFIAWAYFNPQSQISLRLLEWQEEIEINETWWYNRLFNAIKCRKSLKADGSTSAYRLVHAESDFLPGLIVDLYGDFIVLQALTAGIDKVKPILIKHLKSILNPKGIYERSDTETRKLEGLSPVQGVLYGETPVNLIEIRENGFKFKIDIINGQKTGFFLDQRENRKITASYVKKLKLLDCFSYTGAFSVYALSEGAESVVCIDSSSTALEIARQNFELNGLAFKPELVLGNTFQILRDYRNAGIQFDMIILDPPKLSPTKALREKASQAYKDINLIAMKLLKEDGILATFSCSSGIDAEFFKEILSWASIDAHREIQILKEMHQAEDHPVRLSFPESGYLKGFILRVC